jgi:enamine deaminase RidA (YjgF/YER057c/UK114 family)
MGDTIEKRLADLGVILPAAAAPAANYVPFARSGNQLFTAGQLPLKDGKLQAAGLLGRDIDTAAGREAAKLCAINILAQVKAALGDIEKVARVV